MAAVPVVARVVLRASMTQDDVGSLGKTGTFSVDTDKVAPPLPLAV